MQQIRLIAGVQVHAGLALVCVFAPVLAHGAVGDPITPLQALELRISAQAQRIEALTEELRAQRLLLDRADVVATISHTTASLIAEHRLTLLEAFAEKIAEILIVEFGAHWVRVRVVKPRKFDDVRAVGVQIERFAPQPESTRPGHSADVIRLLASGMLPGKA